MASVVFSVTFTEERVLSLEGLRHLRNGPGSFNASFDGVIERGGQPCHVGFLVNVAEGDLDELRKNLIDSVNANVDRMKLDLEKRKTMVAQLQERAREEERAKKVAQSKTGAMAQPADGQPQQTGEANSSAVADVPSGSEPTGAPPHSGDGDAC